MYLEPKERWFQLCEQAVTEQDPDKLFELIHEINALLEEKQAKIKQLRAGNNTNPQDLRASV